MLASLICVIYILQDFDLLTMQSNQRNPLQRAVERRSSSFVHYFVKECNVDISSLDEVNANNYVCSYSSVKYVCTLAQLCTYTRTYIHN